MSELLYLLLVTLLILTEDGLRRLDGALVVTNRDVDNFVVGDAQQLPELIHHQFVKTDVTESGKQRPVNVGNTLYLSSLLFCSYILKCSDFISLCS